MNYRQVYRQICRYAAEHLYSLEVYDEFDSEDAGRIDRAIGELQEVLLRKAEGRRYATSPVQRAALARESPQ